LRGGLGDVETFERLQSHQLLVFGKDLEQREQRVAVVEPAEHHIGDDIEARHEVELLEDHGAVALPVAQGLAPEAGNRAALEGDRAVRNVDQAVDHAQQGGLAGAGATDDADHLAGGNVEADIVHGGLGTEPPRHSRHLEHASSPEAFDRRLRVLGLLHDLRVKLLLRNDDSGKVSQEWAARV